jgi:hypothetical protein
VLAAPQQQVLRMLAITRLADVFAVRPCVGEAAGIAGCLPAAIAPDSGSPPLPAAASQTPCWLRAAGDPPDSAARTPRRRRPGDSLTSQEGLK